jgi:hypothetical protein
MEDVTADITRKQLAANQIMHPKAQAEVYNSKVRTSAAVSKKEDDSQRKLASH